MTFLGEGWTSYSYLVNGSLVFRFPKRPDAWPELEREIAFLAFAADALPLEVPRYCAVVRTSTAAAHGYAVYSYVSGKALTCSDLSGDDRSASAGAIATFLRSLHRYEPSESAAHRLLRVDERACAIEIQNAAERGIIGELSRTQAHRLRDLFAWYLNTPSNFSFSPVVIHADLSGDHLLVTEGRVTGVIDFSDVSLGDPDYDFSSLFIDFGSDFTIDVARRYGHADMRCLLEKLRYFELPITSIRSSTATLMHFQGNASWLGTGYGDASVDSQQSQFDGGGLRREMAPGLLPQRLS